MGRIRTDNCVLKVERIWGMVITLLATDGWNYARPPQGEPPYPPLRQFPVVYQSAGKLSIFRFALLKIPALWQAVSRPSARW